MTITKLTSNIQPLDEVGKINEIIDDVNTNTSAISTKQDTLVSGTNIKTINSQSILGSGDLVVAGSVRNIGEVVASSVPLTDAGLHLFDGSLVLGGGIYDAFVDYISTLQNSSTKYINISQVGTLTNSDCVISGFNTSNYGLLPVTFAPASNTWEFVFKFTTSSNITDTQTVFASMSGVGGVYSGVALMVNASLLGLQVSTNSSSYNVSITTSVSANTTYWVKAEFTGSAYNLYTSSDGTTYTLVGSATNSSPAVNTVVSRIGVYGNVVSGSFLGSIDLKESYINISGSRFWTGAHTADFTDEAQWQETITLSGVCDKFVYNSVNNTVRIPKWGNQTITGLTIPSTVPSKGNGKTLGLTNGAVNCGLGTVSNNTGYLIPNTNTYGQSVQSTIYNNAESRGAFGITTDGNNSGIITDLSTLKAQQLNIYYYIVLATSAKTDIEVDIDQIATDLNSKADVDLTNINTSGKEKITTASLPSWTSSTNITIGAAGATYTAPSDGWLNLAATVTNQTSGWIQVSVGGLTTRGGWGGSLFSVFLPIRKGQTYSINYNAIDTWFWAKFITAQGEL